MIKYKSVRELIENIKSIVYLTSGSTGLIDKTEEEILVECLQLQDEGLLTIKYEVRCPECLTIIKTYETFNQIEENLECTHCGEENEINILNDTRVLFYVVKGEV